MEDPLETTTGGKLTHCRFCAAQKIYSEIIDFENDLKTRQKLEELIRLSKNDFIDLSKRKILPKHGCEACFSSIEEIHDFFIKIKKSILYDPIDVKKEKFEEKLTTTTSDSLKSCEASTSMQNISNLSNENKCKICTNSVNIAEQLNLQNDEMLTDDLKKLLTFFKIPHDIDAHFTACNNCYNNLNKSHSFILNVQHCQPLLREIYKTESSASRVKIEIEIQNSSTTEDEDKSWTSYVYVCCHCQYVFKSMHSLRSHSKELHKKCKAFKCVDCGVEFGNFMEFVDHVREHRNELCLYCQYCNEGFSSVSECDQHVQTHNISTSKICDLCGEVLPFANILEWHKKLYGTNESEQIAKSWEDYDWSCQDCNAKFALIKDLRYHIQSEHGKCFAMKCMDCDTPNKAFMAFVAHVITHRPHLKNFCQFCNEHFEDAADLNKHLLQHITSQQRPCLICGQIFSNNIELAYHKAQYSKRHYTKTSKPSTKADQAEVKQEPRKRRRKPKPSLSSEDLTCKVCGKICDDMTKLTRHVKTHDANRPREHVCKVCKKAFLTNGTLVAHQKIHSPKSIVCQICGWKFHTKHRLKHHLVTHAEDKPYVCDECGNCFKTKRRLKCHLQSHSNIKPYKCVYCGKEFRFVQCMKTHELQHTGVRPYTCELCDRTFTNWTNCNKHMIRRHGVTLAKTKITPIGRISINRKTGEAKKVSTDDKAKEWMQQMLQPEKPGKKTVAAVVFDSSE